MNDRARRPHRSAIGLALWVALAGSVAGAQEQEIVDWRDAPECVGRVCAVAGTVAVVEDDGAVIRLFFDAERRDVAVILVRAWFTTWPRYIGQAIVATGHVRRFRQRTEIVARTPGALAVQEPQPSVSPTTAALPAPPPAAVPTGVPTPPEVQRLRQRVRELEEQLRERDQ